jgi:hypothetical protein
MLLDSSLGHNELCRDRPHRSRFGENVLVEDWTAESDQDVALSTR